MVSEDSVSLEDAEAMVKKKSVGSKKNGAKVPKKSSKAEREKLKRDRMNVLFLELGKALEPDNQNNGKSSTITDTIRILRDLLAQVDCLKKENATLLSESQYVTVEKDELKEENSALESQIGNLQTEIARFDSQSLWRLDTSQTQSLTGTIQPLEDHLMLPVVDPATQAVGPVFVMPLQNDPQLYSNPDVSENVCKLPPNVSRPHARYPSPSDTWTSNILLNNHKQIRNS